MFSLNEGNRYVVCLQGVDLRKGLDGLCGLIRYLSFCQWRCICVSEQKSHHHEVASLGAGWLCNLLQTNGKRAY